MAKNDLQKVSKTLEQLTILLLIQETTQDFFTKGSVCTAIITGTHWVFIYEQNSLKTTDVAFISVLFFIFANLWLSKCDLVRNLSLASKGKCAFSP